MKILTDDARTVPRPCCRGAGVGVGERGSDVVERLDPLDDFNFTHFRMRHMVAELIRTYRHSGIAPGAMAPDFELWTPDGTTIRLSSLRGRPVLLHFVSYTCPVTRGGAELMRNLHDRYGDRVQFVDVLVRQAHPGERRGRYVAFDEKLADARRYRQEEAVTWPVAVDDLDGTVQHLYGGMSASAYLIDATGRVTHYAMWGPTPGLTTALDQVVQDGGGSNAAPGTVDAVPHLGAAIVSGQGGPARGGFRSFFDLELGFPGAMLLMSIGRIFRPLLDPVLQRTTPLSARVRRTVIAAIGAGALVLLCAGCRRRPQRARGRVDRPASLNCSHAA